MKEFLREVLGDKSGLLEVPVIDGYGDLALPCFSFAKELKKSPGAIAAQIKQEAAERKSELIERMEVAGGYLNFFLNRSVVADLMIDEIKNDKCGKVLAGTQIFLEHTSINPNASPHIGRARNAFIGDAIARLCRFLGASVEVHYFVNDIGKQISLLVYALNGKTNVTFNVLAAEYVKANEELKKNPTIEKIVFEQLEKLERGDRAMQARFLSVVDICLNGQSKLFDELGIKYDFFDYESVYVVNNEVDKVLERLKKTGRLFEDEVGRLVMNLEGYDIGQKMLPLTRADKTSLYPLRDICYSIEKAEKKCDNNIIVLGEDQKMYFKQINAVLDILGYPTIQTVHYSFVLLEDGKMSTRAGNVVMLEDIMKEALTLTKTEKHAQELGYGAIKYAILKCSASKNVLFDWKNVLNTQGDSGIYLQYCYARIASLLKKDSRKIVKPDVKIFTDDVSWKLLKTVYRFCDELTSAMNNNFAISDLAAYLYSLAQLFSGWYANTKIVGSDNIWLAAEVGKVIKKGLWILGINVVDEM